jgi:hypothetical protein
MNLLWAIPKKTLQITDKSIYVTFSSGFKDDILIVIVSEKYVKLLLNMGLIVIYVHKYIKIYSIRYHKGTSIPQSSRQLLILHLRFVFPDSPSSSTDFGYN